MKRIILCVVMLALCGCQEQQQWGQGDPDPVWQGYFGNDNHSRILFVMKNKSNGHGQSIANLMDVTKNLADKIHDLEARPVHEIIVFDPNDIMVTVPCEVTQ